MNVLMVSPYPTHPATGGNRARIRGLAQELVRLGHEVHFLYWAIEQGLVSLRGMASLFGRERVHAPIFRATEVYREYVRKPTGQAFGVDDWYSEHLSDHLAALGARHRFDVVIAEYVFLSKALELFPDALRLLNVHDSFADRAELYRAIGRRPRWFHTSLEEELRGFNRADVVIASHDADAAAFRGRRNLSASVVSIGHFVDLERTAEPADNGAAAYLAGPNLFNVHDVGRFLDEVAPRIAERAPDFRLIAAGRICEQLADHPRLQKAGEVAHPADAFSLGAVSLAPARAGTGASIKLLESVAAGAPTVATRTGARGLVEALDGGLVVVDDERPAAFADAVLALLSDAGLRRELAARGRRRVVDWRSLQVETLRRTLQRAA